MESIDKQEAYENQKQSWMMINPETFFKVFPQGFKESESAIEINVSETGMGRHPSPPVVKTAAQRAAERTELASRGLELPHQEDLTIVVAVKRWKAMKASKENEKNNERAKMDPRIKQLEQYSEDSPGSSDWLVTKPREQS